MAVKENTVDQTLPMSVYERLVAVQRELKAPKGQYNSFGKYNYRSSEDIIEAVKPLLATQGLVLTISDEIVQVGSQVVPDKDDNLIAVDRVYVKATARVTMSDGSFIESVGWAREPVFRKGMDESQITGATSSYARKYALNGLFAIDDAKDPDTDEAQLQTGESKRQAQPNKGFGFGKSNF